MIQTVPVSVHSILSWLCKVDKINIKINAWVTGSLKPELYERQMPHIKRLWERMHLQPHQ